MLPLQQQRLSDLLSIPVHWGCRLAEFTTLAIGGPAEAVVRVDHRHELQPLLAFLEVERIPWRVIGRGSNLLVADEGFAGVIVLLGGKFKEITPVREDSSGRLLKVGGGVSLARLSRTCTALGLRGLEFAGGIPGTVAGAVVMNAGAWGEEMAGVVCAVTLFAADGSKHLTADAGELDFAYRCWPGFAAHRGSAVIAAVDLLLSRDDPGVIAARARRLADKRLASQPLGQGNAGSFFKNPPGDSAGRLIEASGLKGLRVGGAMVSEQHANFLVNTGGATAKDMLALMKIIQAKVESDTGIALAPEVHFL